MRLLLLLQPLFAGRRVRGTAQYRTLDFRHKHTQAGRETGAEAHVARLEGVRIVFTGEQRKVASVLDYSVSCGSLMGNSREPSVLRSVLLKIHMQHVATNSILFVRCLFVCWNSYV